MEKEKYILNLEEFNYFEKERDDKDTIKKLNYLDLYFLEDKVNITNEKEIKKLIIKLEENIIQSMKEIMWLKSIQKKDIN
tara:strand:+ start:879 stop:1118 length:240 start_codon:yes stop_codon:yes gene_type:complete